MTFRDGINKGEAYFDWTTYQYINPNANDTTGLNDGVITSADIMQINNYYPFGLNMEGNWNGAKGDNKYGFNGKEWNDDFGLGWNHHDWRFLDVAINRFVTLDPEAESDGQISISPYHFSYNNPIKYSDPDGREPEENGPGDPPSAFEKILIKVIEFIANYGSATSGRANDTQTQFNQNFGDGVENLINDGLFLQGHLEMGRVNLKGRNIASEEQSVQKEVNIELRATTIQNAQTNRIARNQSTTAVALATNSNGKKETLVASSRNRLTPAQRNALQAGEKEVKGKGHAEATINNHAKKNGLKIEKLAASRPVCVQCQEELKKSNVKIVSPVKVNNASQAKIN